MSYVTSVVLFTGAYDMMDGRLVKILNIQLDEDLNGGITADSGFQPLKDDPGGRKVFVAGAYAAAFNYGDMDGLKKRVAELPWCQPEEVVLAISDEESFIWEWWHMPEEAP